MSVQTPQGPALQVRKRSGTVVEFRKAKITQAVLLCLVNDCGRENDDATRKLADKVTVKVEKLIKHTTGAISVEAIQDFVEQALMALGEHEAAKQYILFRDERRRLRDAASMAGITEAVLDPIREESKLFALTGKSDLQRFQHYDKYARFNDDFKRRETYPESARRVMDFTQDHLTAHAMPALTDAEYNMLFRAIVSEQATPSMRLMQMAGPAAKRCNVGIYNCSYNAIRDVESVVEILYNSMAGSGCGFSCESEFIEQLPRVKRRNRRAKPKVYYVEDNTEAWCDSVKDLAYALYDGLDLDIRYDRIRPAGQRLMTKGGTSSGPGVLIELHTAMRRIFWSREGKRLRDIDVHDWVCYVGQVGQMGGVRRAALISISDFQSQALREAKFGRYWDNPLHVQRAMSNNSAAYDEKPSAETFLQEWTSLIISKSGERGIFNRGGLSKQLPTRRIDLWGGVDAFNDIRWGCNPCGEILLHPDGQFCNLSIAICRVGDTEADLLAKVELAAIFGTLQSTMTNFKYLRPHWKANCDKERLLGVDLLGALDNPLLRETNPGRNALLERLRDRVIETNRVWAARLGIPASSATTCIKPGGNSGARYAVGQSMAGWLTEHMIRNVEVGNVNPMCRFLKDQGVPNEISYRDPNTTVFSFPLKAPEGAMIVSDLITDANGKVVQTKPRRSAVEQLNDWLAFKRHYTEHNPSVTIYVADDEWVEVGAWVYRNWDDVGGLAFLPLDGGVYEQAPFTPLTKAAFDEFNARFPKIEWEKLPRYEKGIDHTNVRKEMACTGDKCERI